MRLLCEHFRKFGQKMNPCRKVLAEIKGVVVEYSEGEITVDDAREIVLKCPGCGQKTKIKMRR